MSDSFASVEKKAAREAAYMAVEKLKPEATSVIEYQSQGHVAIIGDTTAIKSFGELPASLTCETVEYQGEIPRSDIRVSGALGQFVIHVAKQEIKADLVLDLTSNPFLSMELKPPGYFIANPLKSDCDDIKNEMSGLVGTFEKPQYFDFNASACAHGRSGKTGCSRCIDACPAEAITSLMDKIEVDPFLCQGGGVCATVCPSSAITYAYPKPKDLLTHVRTLILTYLQEGGDPPDLLFVTEDEREQPEQILPASLIVVVEEVASVGPEVWLSALAWGARAVRLFDLNTMPRSARVALDQSVKMVQALLIGANYPASSVLVISDLSDLLTSSTMPIFELATHAAISGKRQSLYMAMDHLIAKSQKVEAIVELPEKAIFGEVTVDTTKCTLCMACVSSCPGNALQAGNEKPLLGFIEENCFQCEICINSCPESAMSMSPRFIMDHKVRSKVKTLNEEDPFCCISCGKPFATKSGITTILSKLEGHSMFADERSKNRLKMCDDCRVKDMMEDPTVDF